MKTHITLSIDGDLKDELQSIINKGRLSSLVEELLKFYIKYGEIERAVLQMEERECQTKMEMYQSKQAKIRHTLEGRTKKDEEEKEEIEKKIEKIAESFKGYTGDKPLVWTEGRAARLGMTPSELLEEIKKRIGE